MPNAIQHNDLIEEHDTSLLPDLPQADEAAGGEDGG